MQEISICDPTITLRFREIFRYRKIVSETTQETLPTKNMLTALNFLNTCGKRKMKKIIYIYIYIFLYMYMLISRNMLYIYILYL